MDLLAEGRSLVDIPAIESGGELRIYLDKALDYEGVREVQAKFGSEARVVYDYRILGIKFSNPAALEIARALDFTLGWQLFGTTTGTSILPWVGVAAGALTLAYLASRGKKPVKKGA